jgi:hypothetical protein
MIDVGRHGLWVALALCGSASVAAADKRVASLQSTAEAPMEQRWPSLPHYHETPIEDQITDHLTDLGNLLGQHLDLLSHDMFKIHVDGRAQRASIRLGGGDVHFLHFRVDSDWHFAQDRARVAAKLELGIAGHEIDVQLPAMDLSVDSYHGEQLVQLNVPLLERHF